MTVILRVPYGFEEGWTRWGTPPPECDLCGAAFGENHNYGVRSSESVDGVVTFRELSEDDFCRDLPCDDEECPTCLWRRAYCPCNRIHRGDDE